MKCMNGTSNILIIKNNQRMKYNIYTILNSEYIRFGRIFLNSLFDTHNINNIKNIYILNMGLNNKHKEFISNFNKVKLIEPDDGIVELEEGTGWTNVVCSKTYYLKKLIKETENICPIVMIDSDCLFLKDIESLIDLDYDFQVCKRNNNNKLLLASFMSFNNRIQSIILLDKWIEKIKTINKDWKETKALIKIYEEENDFNFGLIPLNQVSVLHSKNINNNSRIIHFKSSTNQNKKIKIEQRIYRRGFKKYVKKYDKEK